MSSEDIIRAWKDPDQEGGGFAADHPAGRIDLGADPDTVGGSATPWISASIALSAATDCFESILHGSCGPFSIGCCPTAVAQ